MMDNKTLLLKFMNWQMNRLMFREGYDHNAIADKFLKDVNKYE